MERIMTLTIEEVRPHLLGEYSVKKAKNAMSLFDNLETRESYWAKVGTLRLVNFQVHGFKCAKCGLKGTFFALERSIPSGPYHLNLYAINKNGKEVLMTVDHIKPLSKGGANDINNTQTMCRQCNQKKGSD